MIWLKKVRNDRLYDGKLNVAVFLQQMMEPFEDYMKSIKEKGNYSPQKIYKKLTLPTV